MMRAKLMVQDVVEHKYAPAPGEPEKVSSIQLKLTAVCGKPFDAEGNSEDNSFAKWTPSADVSMSITNPALFSSFKRGQKFYVDFTEAPEPVAHPSEVPLATS